MLKWQMYGRAGFSLLHPRQPSSSVTTKFAEEPADLPGGGHLDYLV
jgi:hypothetical protein